MAFNLRPASDHRILFTAKNQLVTIKADNETTFSKKCEALKLLLINVASVTKHKESSEDKAIAAWFLMADIYGFMAILYSEPSVSNADVALTQATRCLDQARTVIKSLPEGKKLDVDFIRACNTQDIADIDEGLKLILNLTTSLKEQLKEKNLFSNTM